MILGQQVVSWKLNLPPPTNHHLLPLTYLPPQVCLPWSNRIDVAAIWLHLPDMKWNKILVNASSWYLCNLWIDIARPGLYRVFSLTWPASMQIYWNKRKRLHKKRVQLPQDWFGTPTWPPFHCFGTPIWPPWRHVKTLYTCRNYNIFIILSLMVEV